MEVGNSAITGGNDQIGLQWGWDDDDRGGMDIQALLSEFGDFGDFFENDVLTFGEVIITLFKIPLLMECDIACLLRIVYISMFLTNVIAL